MKDKKSKPASFGVFSYDEDFKSYELDDGKIYWSIKPEHEDEDTLNKLIYTAEKLYGGMASFEQKAKAAIADELIDYKNDFWPEYDEDDENLDWDAVEAGEYEVTIEEFGAALTLLHIVIRANEIYCEYDDGEMFGGHRIHAYFDQDYNLLKADT